MQGTNAADLTCHPTWFMHDGDIVLRASNLQSSPIVFKVHRAVLAHHSPVFAGLFSLPSRDGVDEEYDGTPLIQMHDDADELADLIGALYDSDLPSMRPLDPRNPERARGAMKLARKYEIESVRARIIRRMEADWPQDVLEWLRLIGDIKRRTELRTMLCRTGTSSDPEPEAFVPEPASAVRFAREFDVPSILPAAFYTLALADIQQDWDETRVSRPFAAAQWRLLDQEDTMRLFRGKSKLRAAASAMVKVPFPGESYCTDCKDSRLPRVFSEKWSTYLTSGGFEGGVALADAPDIIGILLSCLELLEGRGSQFAGMCETHRILYRKFVSAKLHHEWESLSEKFQLR